MDKIVKKIQAILEEALKVKSALDTAKEKSAKVALKQDKVELAQSEVTAELEKREADVKPIEDVVAYRMATDEAAKNTRIESVLIGKRKNEFNEYIKEEKNKLRLRQIEVNSMEKRYYRELKALKKAKEDVEKERLAVKGQVIDSLTKNI